MNAVGVERSESPLPARFDQYSAYGERQISPVDSTDRRNTLCESLCWGLILQGLARAFIELACNRAQFCLGMV